MHTRQDFKMKPSGLRYGQSYRWSKSWYLWVTSCAILGLLWLCVSNIVAAQSIQATIDRRSFHEETTGQDYGDFEGSVVERAPEVQTPEVTKSEEDLDWSQSQLVGRSEGEVEESLPVNAPRVIPRVVQSDAESVNLPNKKNQQPLRSLGEDAQDESDTSSDHAQNSETPQSLQSTSHDDDDSTMSPVFELADSTVAKQDVYARPPAPIQAFTKYAALVEKAEDLPEVVHIPFEDAVKKDRLHGWEMEWIADRNYNTTKWGLFKEPRIDFVYTWVNGSDEAFRKEKQPYERNSSLNDAEGKWLAQHSSNRYRDWNELKYSVRSVERYAPFRNKIQLLVNAVQNPHNKQIPSWLDTERAEKIFEVLSQQDYFETDKKDCLPTFNSISMENQIHNTPSGVDQMFALSDDMLLGRPHAASDIYSPLFGPLFAFKTNAYSSVRRPSDADAQRFGEKPWLIYTSWLLNRRFGVRKRKGQVHFGHSLSRRVTKEAMNSFPGPELQSACSRFRGDFGFQLYSWYAVFHYTIERHREALLWSYIMHRSDPDGDGYLSWPERQQMIKDIEEGLQNEASTSYRARNYYHLPEILEAAGLQPPKVNLDILWTSMDGPVTMKDIDCFTFDVNDCLAPGFSSPDSGTTSRSPVFSTTTIFDRVARQQPECGDCLAKILLHRAPKGLSPMMPDKKTQPAAYEIVTKALIRYQYVVNEPDSLFVMVTDAEQVDSTLVKRLLEKKKAVGQLCLNDDVSTEDPGELEELYEIMRRLFEGLQPRQSRFEKRV